MANHRPVHDRRSGCPVALADYFVVGDWDAHFHDTRSGAPGPYNVRPPRCRTDNGSDPTEVPLAHVHARCQGLRSLVRVKADEVPEATGTQRLQLAFYNLGRCLKWTRRTGGKTPPRGNRYRQRMVDNASLLVLSYPLRTKDAENVAEQLLELSRCSAFHAPYGEIPRRSSRRESYNTSSVGDRCPSATNRPTTHGHKEQWRGWRGELTWVGSVWRKLLVQALGRVRATGTLVVTHDASPAAVGKPHPL